MSEDVDPPAWLLRAGVGGLLMLAWGRFLGGVLGTVLVTMGSAVVIAAGTAYFALLLRRGRDRE